jgi:hypothetical protein
MFKWILIKCQEQGLRNILSKESRMYGMTGLKYELYEVIDVLLKPYFIYSTYAPTLFSSFQDNADCFHYA